VKPTAAAAEHTADIASDTVDAQASGHVLLAARSARHCAVVSAAVAAAAWMFSRQSAVAVSNDCVQFSAQPAASDTAPQHRSLSILAHEAHDSQYYTWGVPVGKSPQQICPYS